MKKEKIAFVVIRYGQNITGGAEYHCRMLAERLTDEYDVDVLTTCVIDYLQGGNVSLPEEEFINDVRVRRFKAYPVDDIPERTFARKVKWVRRLRRFLYRVGCLSLLAPRLQMWSRLAHNEVEAAKRSVFYSEALNEYIRRHKDEYKVFLVFTVDYAPFYFTALYAGEKAIAIPTMHNARNSFRAMHAASFSRYAYIGFNARGEQRLAERMFGKTMKQYGIISTGIENQVAAPWEETRAKYALPEKYILYLGRIDKRKLGRLFFYFAVYKKRYPLSPVKLVMVGGALSEDKMPEHSDIVYTGFVSDAEKNSILRHAEVVVNPSKYESLSLIVLEALSDGVPVLVDGHCRVLRDHCTDSNYAVDYYLNHWQFVKKLHRLLTCDDLRRQKIERGRQYVDENYNWNLIMTRLRTAINLVAHT